MSENDELPSWAGHVLQPGANLPRQMQPPPRRRRRGLWALLAVLSLGLLGGVGYLGYWLADRADDGSVAASSEAGANTTEAGSDNQLSAGASSSTVATQTSTTQASTTTAQATTVTTTAATVDPATADENPEGTSRYAVFKGGQVFLRGKVPSEAVGAEIQTKAGAVVGPDNVFNEYQIDPSVPVDVPAPLYVQDVVLFGFNSVKIEPPFLPILDLGTKLLSLNPNVKIVVVARTDAAGNEKINLEISRKRAQAVIDYWARKGIDPSRLTTDPRGETGSSETDDPQTAALERRAEFIISGLLD